METPGAQPEQGSMVSLAIGFLPYSCFLNVSFSNHHVEHYFILPTFSYFLIFKAHTDKKQNKQKVTAIFKGTNG